MGYIFNRYKTYSYGIFLGGMKFLGENLNVTYGGRFTIRKIDLILEL